MAQDMTGMYKCNADGTVERWIVKPDDPRHLCMYRPINNALEFWCAKCEENVTPESKVKTRDIWCPKCKGELKTRVAEKTSMADWMEEPDNGDECTGGPPDKAFTFDSDHPLKDVIFYCSNRDCVHGCIKRDGHSGEPLKEMHMEPYGPIHCKTCGCDTITAELTTKLEKKVFGFVS